MALQLAGPVAGPVRIAPQFESFYTFPVGGGSKVITLSIRELLYHEKANDEIENLIPGISSNRLMLTLESGALL